MNKKYSKELYWLKKKYIVIDPQFSRLSEVLHTHREDMGARGDSIYITYTAVGDIKVHDDRYAMSVYRVLMVECVCTA